MKARGFHPMNLFTSLCYWIGALLLTGKSASFRKDSEVLQQKRRNAILQANSIPAELRAFLSPKDQLIHDMLAEMQLVDPVRANEFRMEWLQSEIRDLRQHVDTEPHREIPRPPSVVQGAFDDVPLAMQTDTHCPMEP